MIFISRLQLIIPLEGAQKVFYQYVQIRVLPFYGPQCLFSVQILALVALHSMMASLSFRPCLIVLNSASLLLCQPIPIFLGTEPSLWISFELAASAFSID